MTLRQLLVTRTYTTLDEYEQLRRLASLVVFDRYGGTAHGLSVDWWTSLVGSSR